ncbi:unnamed protein product [Rotaria sp. Silwood2]|nr:unnamed protein product [Rotaria sp. Silwood2]
MFLINQCNLIINTSPTTIIINVDKGIALEQIGVYSEKFVESIFHIFIPFNNLCVDSPNSDVCEYVQSTDPDIVEIGTLISPYQMSMVYNQANISRAIQHDIGQIFSYHKIHKIIAKAKSIVYFIDDTFYVPRSNSQSIMNNFTISTNVNERTLIHRGTNPATLALEQVFNNKVGYDFLTDEQIVEFLPLIRSIISQKFDVEDIKENMNVFINMIIGQAVYALKSCSIRQNEQLPSGPACLVVSTIIRRISTETSSFYQVYHLTPLPVFFNGEKYIYSDLPKIFGFNKIEKKVILWNDDNFSTACTFSKIIQCRNQLMNIPLSTVPCLDELMNTESSSISKCQVTRSKNIQSNLINIKSNIWYIFSSGESFECESQSLSSLISDFISVKEPMIVTFPCDKSVRCSNIQLPQTTCINTTVMITTKYNATLKKQSVPGLDRLMIHRNDGLVPLMAASVGITKYEQAFRSIVWRIDQLPKRDQGAHETHLFECKMSITSYDPIPEKYKPIADVEYSMSQAFISHCQIFNKKMTVNDGACSLRQHVQHSLGDDFIESPSIISTIGNDDDDGTEDLQLKAAPSKRRARGGGRQLRIGRKTNPTVNQIDDDDSMEISSIRMTTGNNNNNNNRTYVGQESEQKGYFHHLLAGKTNIQVLVD